MKKTIKEILELENHLSKKGFQMNLLTRENALVFIQELHNSGLLIYGFDDFKYIVK